MKGKKRNDAFDDHFGLCPTCHGKPDLLNVGRVHFMVCHEHRCFWTVGSNLFGSWKNESEETWRENEATLNLYNEVKEYRHPLQCMQCGATAPKEEATWVAGWIGIVANSRRGHFCPKC